MEETVQEKKTFKWGDNEYLLDDLLKLHADQEQNYYNFAKAKGNYDDSALQGLRTAITNRINAAKSGKVFGSDGSLDDDVVDNISDNIVICIFRKIELIFEIHSLKYFFTPA